MRSCASAPGSDAIGLRTRRSWTRWRRKSSSRVRPGRTRGGRESFVTRRERCLSRLERRHCPWSHHRALILLAQSRRHMQPLPHYSLGIMAVVLRSVWVMSVSGACSLTSARNVADISKILIVTILGSAVVKLRPTSKSQLDDMAARLGITSQLQQMNRMRSSLATASSEQAILDVAARDPTGPPVCSRSASAAALSDAPPPLYLSLSTDGHPQTTLPNGIWDRCGNTRAGESVTVRRFPAPASVLHHVTPKGLTGAYASRGLSSGERDNLQELNRREDGQVPRCCGGGSAGGCRDREDGGAGGGQGAEANVGLERLSPGWAARDHR